MDTLIQTSVCRHTSWLYLRLFYLGPASYPWSYIMIWTLTCPPPQGLPLGSWGWCVGPCWPLWRTQPLLSQFPLESRPTLITSSWLLGLLMYFHPLSPPPPFFFSYNKVNCILKTFPSVHWLHRNAWIRSDT